MDHAEDQESKEQEDLLEVWVLLDPQVLEENQGLRARGAQAAGPELRADLVTGDPPVLQVTDATFLERPVTSLAFLKFLLEVEAHDFINVSMFQGNLERLEREDPQDPAVSPVRLENLESEGPPAPAAHQVLTDPPDNGAVPGAGERTENPDHLDSLVRNRNMVLRWFPSLNRA